MCHVSNVMCHLVYVTCHMLRVTCNIFLALAILLVFLSLLRKKITCLFNTRPGNYYLAKEVRVMYNYCFRSKKQTSKIFSFHKYVLHVHKIGLGQLKFFVNQTDFCPTPVWVLLIARLTLLHRKYFALHKLDEMDRSHDMIPKSPINSKYIHTSKKVTI